MALKVILQVPVLEVKIISHGDDGLELRYLYVLLYSSGYINYLVHVFRTLSECRLKFT